MMTMMMMLLIMGVFCRLQQRILIVVLLILFFLKFTRLFFPASLHRFDGIAVKGKRNLLQVIVGHVREAEKFLAPVREGTGLVMEQEQRGTERSGTGEVGLGEEERFCLIEGN
jgi:hypothetical protein